MGGEAAARESAERGARVALLGLEETHSPGRQATPDSVSLA
ncbi:hypothetical protein ACFPN0_30430 [Kitasatospora cinereorecta]